MWGRASGNNSHCDERHVTVQLNYVLVPRIIEELRNRDAYVWHEVPSNLNGLH
jgi:hypothetical protein